MGPRVLPGWIKLGVSNPWSTSLALPVILFSKVDLPTWGPKSACQSTGHVQAACAKVDSWAPADGNPIRPTRASPVFDTFAIKSPWLYFPLEMSRGRWYALLSIDIEYSVRFQYGHCGECAPIANYFALVIQQISTESRSGWLAKLIHSVIAFILLHAHKVNTQLEIQY